MLNWLDSGPDLLMPFTSRFSDLAGRSREIFKAAFRASRLLTDCPSTHTEEVVTTLHTVVKPSVTSGTKIRGQETRHDQFSKQCGLQSHTRGRFLFLTVVNPVA